MARLFKKSKQWIGHLLGCGLFLLPLYSNAKALKPEQLWSLQPLSQTTVPKIKSAKVRNEIDGFIQNKLIEKGIVPSPLAEDATLIRRLYLDLHGLLPHPQTVKEYCEDKDPQKYSKLIEKLLASPRYGERWARHWLDVVRYADSNGFETNHERKNAYHYRDYVIRSLNQDKPYDQFVFEQIAGDTCGADEATGFLVAGPKDIVGGEDPLLAKQQRANELADMVGVTGSTFLGLTIGCARCHDHKFDPVSQSDFFSMQSVFEGVVLGERPINREISKEKLQKIAQTEEQIEEIEASLLQYKPKGKQVPRFVWMDDRDMTFVSHFYKKNGHGDNPKGKARGFLDDPGSAKHSPNLSGGSYTWWTNKSGEPAVSYQAAVEGMYRVWLSWGSGWSTHTKDARYLLDQDGKVETTDDRTEIATINQQLLANGAGKIISKPLWSGLQDCGTHSFSTSSKILVYGGNSGGALTTDLIILERADKSVPVRRFEPKVKSTLNEDWFHPVTTISVRFTIGQTNNGIEPCIDELGIWSSEGERANLATRKALVKSVTSSGNFRGSPKHKLAHINDGKFGNDHSWISNTKNTGWIEFTFKQPQRIERVTWGRDKNGKYKDRTPSTYYIEVKNEKGEWIEVASSSHRQPSTAKDENGNSLFAFEHLDSEKKAKARTLLDKLAAGKKALDELKKKPRAWIGSFRQPSPTRLMHRGDPLSPREVISPVSLSAFTQRVPEYALDENSPEKERRKAFAQWLIDPKHPLTARVMVNRIWHYHFGRGIVATPSDFGDMGFRPTHPELLDWLAGKFISQGWSIKQMHRLILQSYTYQQASEPRTEAISIDAGTELLWRFPPRRLEAEAIRDNMLLLSGLLDEKMYGPGFLLFEPNANYARNWIPKDDVDEKDFRRMIYNMRIRMEQDSVFGAFDCPDGGQSAPSRARSTTPLQALNLYNSSFTEKIADAFSQKLLKQTDDSTEQALLLGFESIFGREPNLKESTTASRYVEEHGLAAYCRVLFNANEFLFIP
jgi:hypothetical protein